MKCVNETKEVYKMPSDTIKYFFISKKYNEITHFIIQYIFETHSSKFWKHLRVSFYLESKSSEL